jgi:hypothetical protein
MVVGDNSYEAGHRREAAKNFMTNPKYGYDGVFSRAPYKGDDYEDSYKRTVQGELVQRGIIEPPFKPSDNEKKKLKPPYQYMSDFVAKIFDKKDEHGGVKTGPKNFVTAPMKRGRGATTYGTVFQSFQYIEDPYDRAKELDLMEQVEHKRKMLVNRPFVSNSSRVRTFEKDAKLFEWRPQTANAAERPRLSHSATSTPHPRRPWVVAKKSRPWTAISGSGDMVERDDIIFGLTASSWVANRSRASSLRPWKPNYGGTLERPTPSMTEKFTRMHKAVAVGPTIRR